MSSVAKTINGVHITGILREKKGMYYAVICYRDADNNRKQKWHPTKLPIRGNKKNADVILKETLDAFELPYEEQYAFMLKANPEVVIQENCEKVEIKPENKLQPFEVDENAQLDELSKEQVANMLFADYLVKYLPIAKKRGIEATTYASYSGNVANPIGPYFKEKQIKLCDLQPEDIEEFYERQLERVTANTVIHYHCIIRLSLCYARKQGYIKANPIEEVTKPEKNRYVGQFYSSEELKKLIEKTRNTKLELPVIFGGFYGLRRSEIVGLRWSSFDFENDVFYINHTVTMPNVDGKKEIIAKDRGKSDSSMRALPLDAGVKTRLIEIKTKQEMYRKKFKRSYSKEWLDYVLVDELGGLITPDYISSAFRKFLEANDMRIIRFHDLRHTCASLLLNKGKHNGITLKDIQVWLGHSDFATTANIYSHLDANSKLDSLGTLSSIVAI